MRFRLEDYRDTAGVFDRIVSVGMFEHVGPAHFDAYFAPVSYTHLTLPTSDLV